MRCDKCGKILDPDDKTQKGIFLLVYYLASVRRMYKGYFSKKRIAKSKSNRVKQ